MEILKSSWKKISNGLFYEYITPFSTSWLGL